MTTILKQTMATIDVLNKQWQQQISIKQVLVSETDLCQGYWWITIL